MVDAAVPLDVPVDSAIDPALVPFTASGSTPVGSLDFVRYIRATYKAGFCRAGFYVDLRSTNEVYPNNQTLSLYIPAPAGETPPSRIPVTAQVWLDEETSAYQEDAAYFDVDDIAVPVVYTSSSMLRLAGRLGANADGWMFDIPIDITATQGLCI